MLYLVPCACRNVVQSQSRRTQLPLQLQLATLGVIDWVGSCMVILGHQSRRSSRTTLMHFEQRPCWLCTFFCHV